MFFDEATCNVRWSVIDFKLLIAQLFCWGCGNLNSIQKFKRELLFLSEIEKHVIFYSRFVIFSSLYSITVFYCTFYAYSSRQWQRLRLENQRVYYKFELAHPRNDQEVQVIVYFQVCTESLLNKWACRKNRDDAYALHALARSKQNFQPRETFRTSKIFIFSRTKQVSRRECRKLQFVGMRAKGKKKKGKIRTGQWDFEDAR